MLKKISPKTKISIPLCTLLALATAFTASVSNAAESPTPEACTPEKIAVSRVGSICSVETEKGTVLWKVEHFGAVRDLKSGILVSRVLGKSDYANAASLCPPGMHLPTGYPKVLNGRYDFPNTDSDVATLSANGIGAVVEDPVNSWFLSSSIVPLGPNKRLQLFSYYGDFSSTYKYPSNAVGWVRCVSQGD